MFASFCPSVKEVPITAVQAMTLFLTTEQVEYR